MTIVPIEQIKCAAFPSKKQQVHYNNNQTAAVWTCDATKQEVAEEEVTAEGMGKMQRTKHPTS